MISSIKDKRRENNVAKLLKYFQNAEIVIQQESNIILEKTTEFETRNNKKNFKL